MHAINHFNWYGIGSLRQTKYFIHLLRIKHMESHFVYVPLYGWHILLNHFKQNNVNWSTILMYEYDRMYESFLIIC